MEAFDLGVDGVQPFGSRSEVAVAHGFDVARDDGQRSPQVVGDVGGHLLAELVGARHFAAHAVEGLGQFADLVMAGDGHLLVEVAARHFFGGDGQRAQGMRERARQQESDDEREERRAEGRESQGLIRAVEIRLFLWRESWRQGRGKDRADDSAFHFEGRVAGDNLGGDALAGEELRLERHDDKSIRVSETKDVAAVGWEGLGIELVGLIRKWLLWVGVVNLSQELVEAFDRARVLVVIGDERGKIGALLLENELVEARGIRQADERRHDGRGRDRDEQEGDGEFA